MTIYGNQKKIFDFSPYSIGCRTNWFTFFKTLLEDISDHLRLPEPSIRTNNCGPVCKIRNKSLFRWLAKWSPSLFSGSVSFFQCTHNTGRHFVRSMYSDEFKPEHPLLIFICIYDWIYMIQVSFFEHWYEIWPAKQYSNCAQFLS